MSRPSERRSPTLGQKLALAVGSMLVTFVFLEVGARVWISKLANADQFSKYASLEQYRERVGGEEWWFGLLAPSRYLGYTLAPNLVDGPNRHNSLGMRGDEVPMPKPPGEFRIACLGASTTYTILVPDWHQSYPALLEANLKAAGHPNVRTMNFGVPAWSSYESLIDYLLRVQDLGPDLVVIALNFGDVAGRMVWPPTAYKNDNSGYFAQQFAVREPALWERSAILRVLAVASGAALPASSFGKAVYNLAPTSYYMEYARQRWSMTFPTGIFKDVTIAEMFAANPPTPFVRNVENLVRAIEGSGAKPVVMTFPYCEEITGFFGVPGFKEAVDEHNRLLREIAEREDAVFYDLAAVFPKDKKFWAFDGIHMSAEGAALEAKMVAEFLTGRGLVGGR